LAAVGLDEGLRELADDPGGGGGTEGAEGKEAQGLGRDNYVAEPVAYRQSFRHGLFFLAP
jgi:hypothetical protein